MELLQLDFGGIIQRTGNIFLILLIGGGSFPFVLICMK